MMNYVYMPRLVALRLKGKRGAAVRALAFVADPTHPQFARELSARKRARLVAQGVGGRGRCVDYISETIAHMRGLGVHDPHLERLLAAARALPHGRERTAGRRKRTARR